MFPSNLNSRRMVRLSAASFLFGVLASSGLFAQVKYEIRAKTGDKITATLNFTTSGKARQGSFGAPSISDKGSIAYPCILSGDGITAFSSNSIVMRKKGSKPAVVAVQAGNLVDDSFLPPVPGKPYAVSQTGTLYRIGRNVAINKANKIGFTAQLRYYQNDGGQNGGAFSLHDTAVYGDLLPSGSTFRNVGLSGFVEYYDGILTAPVSLNAQASVVYKANFFVTDTKTVEGFRFSSPTDGGVIATVESPAIGLPYFAQYSAFSEPVISDKNVAFVVADLNDEGAGFDGIWQGSNPNLQPVAVIGGAAPGGGIYAGFDGITGPSRNGSFVAYVANVSTGRAVFRANVDGSNQIRIAAVGDNAPNAAGGVSRTFSNFELVSSNNVGQVVILGNVAGTTKTLAGIWLSDVNGENLELIAVEGQKIKVGSLQKTVTKLAYSPVNGVNRKGQIAFTASFTDRTTAVIVATP